MIEFAQRDINQQCHPMHAAGMSLLNRLALRAKDKSDVKALAIVTQWWRKGANSRDVGMKDSENWAMEGGSVEPMGVFCEVQGDEFRVLD